MPDCHQPTVTRNRSGQDVCRDHAPIVVSGSWVDDKHADGGHG